MPRTPDSRSHSYSARTPRAQSAQAGRAARWGAVERGGGSEGGLRRLRKELAAESTRVFCHARPASSRPGQGGGGGLRASTTPSTGILVLAQKLISLRTSSRLTSCGVVTMMEPSIVHALVRHCASVMCSSDVPARVRRVRRAHVRVGEVTRRRPARARVPASRRRGAARWVTGGPGTCHTRGGINDEEVELAPVRVLEELLDEAVLAHATPDDGVVAVGKHEADGHDAEVVVHVHRLPPQVTLVDLLALQPCHSANGANGLSCATLCATLGAWVGPP